MAVGVGCGGIDVGGPHDSGVVDGSVLDAGASDAGSADAGGIDGSIPDAGEFDASTLFDAGSPYDGGLATVDGGTPVEMRDPIVDCVNGGGTDAGPCFLWSDQVPLSQALSVNGCVAVAPGTYPITKPIVVPKGKTLRGASTSRSAAKFIAGPGFSGAQIVTDDLSNGAIATVSSLTFDMAGRTNGVGARRLCATNLEVKNGTCWGVAIVGTGFTVAGSDIHHNGADPGCPGAPGGGIYVTRSGAFPEMLSPVIHKNSVHHNIGPGLDIAGAWGGQLYGNAVYANSYWAGVSIFGSKWTIHHNQIYHPATNAPGIPDGNKYFSECRGGPNGAHTSAIFICQREDTNNLVSTDNVIHSNALASWYGVLLIGDDERAPYLAPRNNTIFGNDFNGSHNACADDFVPGQWFSDRNHWSGCTPQYF